MVLPRNSILACAFSTSSVLALFFASTSTTTTSAFVTPSRRHRAPWTSPQSSAVTTKAPGLVATTAATPTTSHSLQVFPATTTTSTTTAQTSDTSHSARLPEKWHYVHLSLFYVLGCANTTLLLLQRGSDYLGCFTVSAK